jgi:peptidoglycan-associated lipoprotein
MIRVCRNFFAAGTFAFVLSGCSIVVFEDGPECSALTNCQGATVPSIEMPDAITGPEAELIQPNQNQSFATETDGSQQISEPLRPPPLIDGYVTNFAYDSAEITSQAKDDLEIIAAFLVNKPGVMLIIEGHCDERGSRDYNLALGDRRAVGVREALIASGIDKNKIKTVSYGKERPITSGSTPEAWARNRRAVIRQQLR